MSFSYGSFSYERFQNRCATFNAVTDFLQIECTTGGNLGNTNFFSVCIDIY